MKISTSTILLFAISVGLLFPSGLGIDAGIILNSSKLSLVLILSLGLILNLTGNRACFPLFYVDWLILWFIIWLFIGTLLSGLINTGSFIGTFKYVILMLTWVLAYFPFYFIGRFIREKKNVQAILKGLSFILFVCALIGIIESIFQTNFYGVVGNQLGLNMVGSGSELYRGSLYRARSSLDQPIAFGFAMTAGYVLTDYLVKTQRLTCGNIFKFVFIVTTFLSGSRSSIVAALFCLGVINYHRFGRAAKWLLILGFVIALYWVGSHLDSIFYVDESLLAGEDTAVGQSGNLIGRFQDIEFIQHVMEITPFFGLGLGILHDDSAFSLYYPSLSLYYDKALDNMILAILVESGILGLLMAIICFLAIVIYCYRLRECPEKQFLALLLFLFFAASLSYDLLVFPGAGRLLLLLIALVISSLQLSRKNASNY